MSTPWTGASLSGAAADPWPPFVVHTDRKAINQRYRRVVASAVLGTVAVFALAITFAWLVGQSDLSPLLLVPILLVAVVTGFQVTYVSYLWGSRVVLATPLVLDQTGATATMAQGRLHVPWAAVTKVSIRPLLRNRVLRLHLDPQASATSPGVQTDLEPRFLARLVRSGVLLGSVGVHEDLDQVAAAASQLAGRELRAP